MAHPRLPSDCTLLPTGTGQLLVSRSHATFCGLSHEDSRQMESDEEWPEALRSHLETHGFFAEPRNAEPDRPSAQLQLTNACNLACTYCCTHSGQARGQELSRERWFELIPEISQAMGRGTNVAILGGEPLLQPWALDLASLVLDEGLNLSLFTNGLPLRDEDLALGTARLMERGAEVRISLAGPTAASCDGESGIARFEGALAAIHALSRHGQRPVMDLMLTPQNSQSVAKALPELRKRLPPGIVIAFGLLFHGGRERGAHLFQDRATLEETLDRITFEAGERIDAEQPRPVTFRREGCTCALGAHLHVRSDGRLFTCFRMEECVGDLTQEAFRVALARCLDTPRPASCLPLCAPCPLATLCGGGCRAENIQFTGNGDTPICGPWRVQVISELLAEDHPSALDWPVHMLLAEAHRRGIPAPSELVPAKPSLHLLEV